MDAFFSYVAEVGTIAVPAFAVFLLTRVVFDLIAEFVLGRRGRG